MTNPHQTMMVPPPSLWDRILGVLRPAEAKRAALLLEVHRQIDAVRDKALEVISHAGDARERWMLLQEENLDLAVAEMRMLANVTMQSEFVLRAQSQRTRCDTLSLPQMQAVHGQMQQTLALLEDLRTAAALSALKARHGMLLANPEPLVLKTRRPDPARPVPSRSGKTRVLTAVPAAARPLTTAV